MSLQSYLLILFLFSKSASPVAYSLNGQIASHYVQTDESVEEEEDRGHPLIVQVEINGFSVPAVIDTGAQMSIISEACVKRCHLHKNMETRFFGKAVGVGKSDIIGRVNYMPLRIGPLNFKSRLSVLRESRVDMLIGMDLLNKFQCEINIPENCMKLRVSNKVFKIHFAKTPICNTILPVKKSQYGISTLQSKFIGRLSPSLWRNKVDRAHYDDNANEVQLKSPVDKDEIGTVSESCVTDNEETISLEGV
jgi:hypothetical protein